MSRILFALSSPLIRNNGINTFIRETVSVLRNGGHEVDFITDGPAEIDIQHYFDRYYAPIVNYEYPKFEQVDGHPNVTYLPHITNRIRDLFNSIKVNAYDFIVSNDAQCTAAFVDTSVPLVHYVHTAALIEGENHTYLNDSYVQFEREVMKYCSMVAVPTEEIKSLIPGHYNYVKLGLCLNSYMDYVRKADDPEEGVLFVGEGTLRKGADLFKSHVPDTALQKLVLSTQNEVKFEELPNRIIRTFVNDDKAKADFIRSAKLSYFPSRSETVGYGVLEVLLSQPVIVHSDHSWTRSVIPLGATPVLYEEAEEVIENMLNEPDLHDTTKVIGYFENSNREWLAFADNFKEHFK